MTSRQNGFTLVEVGVIVPILLLLALALFSSMYAYLLSSSQEQARLYQSFAQSTALDRIEADIKLSSGFLVSPDPNMSIDPYVSYSSSTSTNPNCTANTWCYAGSSATNRALILREYATTGNPLASTRSPVFTLAPGAPDCSQASYVSNPLAYNIIYFVKDSVLYKRILNDRSSATCTPQYQKLSCPNISPRNAACAATDEVIATNVSGFSLTYYPDATTSSAVDVYTTASLLSSASSINVTIANSQHVYSGSLSTSSSIRVVTQNLSGGGS